MMPRLLFALIAPLLLASCFISPGKFTSELELLRDGTFSYRYDGEIHFIGLKQLSQVAAAEEAAQELAFEPAPCHDVSDGQIERACSKAELASQRADWEAERERKHAERERDAQMLKAMFGGLDPTSPQAAEEFAARLERQAGWERVVHQGDGVFNVHFAVRGRLDHDFLFPLIEGMPQGNPFVQAIVRKEGVIRVEAPAFAAQDAGNPHLAGMPDMSGLITAMAMSGPDSGKADKLPALPVLDGTFRVVTDGEILANNTDEGPGASGERKVLEWLVNPRTKQAPSALIRLAP